jgi:hypothetical protein
MSQPSTQLRISARNAGQVELDKYCPRCCWYLMRLKRVPFMMGMPGIMFHLEAIQKAYILAQLAEDGCLPRHFGPFSECTEPVKFPFSFFAEHKETGVLVTAQPDMMLRLEDGDICLLDLKTAKQEGGGKFYLPQYTQQVNGYSWVTEENGIGNVGKAGLIYCSVREDCFEEEPLEYKRRHGILVPFDFEAHEVELDYPSFFDCLDEVNKVWHSRRPPAGKNGCKDCELLVRLCDFELELRASDQEAKGISLKDTQETLTQDFLRRHIRDRNEIILPDGYAEEPSDHDGMWLNWDFS